MKCVVKFKNDSLKSKIISEFIKYENCIIDKNKLILNDILIINFGETIECSSNNMNAINLLLSLACNIGINDDSQFCYVEFDSSIKMILIELDNYVFNNFKLLNVNKEINYIDTKLCELSMIAKMSQWLTSNILIKDKIAKISIKLNDCEFYSNVKNRKELVQKIKNNVLSPISLINEELINDYSNTNINIGKLIKVIKSDNGYKKYSKFINDCKNNISIQYNTNSYFIKFNGGTIEFIMLDENDEYPKVIKLEFLEVNNIDNLVVNSISNLFNIKYIDVNCYINDLYMSPERLIKFYNFDKSELFAEFYKNDTYNITYNLYNKIMKISKQIQINDNFSNEYDNIINYSNKTLEDIKND